MEPHERQPPPDGPTPTDPPSEPPRSPETITMNARQFRVLIMMLDAIRWEMGSAQPKSDGGMDYKRAAQADMLAHSAQAEADAMYDAARPRFESEKSRAVFDSAQPALPAG